jgi:hypothetical protein
MDYKPRPVKPCAVLAKEIMRMKPPDQIGCIPGVIPDRAI